MKSVPKKLSDAPMRREYDFSGATVVGKYAKRYREGTNVVLLDPDVADVFPNSKSVNEAALRSLVRVVERRKTKKRT